jgi:hypothetical protein
LDLGDLVGAERDQRRADMGRRQPAQIEQRGSIRLCMSTSGGSQNVKLTPLDFDILSFK